ncbi:MAG: ferrous iron transporter B, partial [Thermoprotei archaeon]
MRSMDISSSEDYEVLLAERRYEVISEIVKRVLRGRREVTFSDLLDKVFLDKYLGIPIFLTLWWALFRFTYDVSAPLSDLIDLLFSRLGELVRTWVVDEILSSFIADGLIAGIGGVLVFLPPIFFLFFGLAILEDSGYLARAAFVFDKLLSKFGLQGRSFIPLLLGFGC